MQDAHGNLGSLLLQDGQTDAAVRHYEFALEYNPGNMCWHVDLGHLYRLQNRLSDAKRCFTAAVELCPSFAIAWSNLACIAKDEGDVNGAIAHYRRAIELDPLFVDAYSNLGRHDCAPHCSAPHRTACLDASCEQCQRAKTGMQHLPSATTSLLCGTWHCLIA